MKFKNDHHKLKMITLSRGPGIFVIGSVRMATQSHESTDSLFFEGCGYPGDLHVVADSAASTLLDINSHSVHLDGA